MIGARLRHLVPVLLVCAAMIGSACNEDDEPTVLQDADLKTFSDRTFSPNEIVPDGALDDLSLDGAAVQRFLEGSGNPYGRTSFLSSYQSNGLRAADAIVVAGARYRINPRLFLVYAQAAQGLVGADRYPFPPSRVEFVFECGCLTPDDCDASLAGFDRQVDCLGRALRTALDAVADSGETVSGFGPGRETLTLDRVLVNPSNAETAAIYDRTPTVANGRGGGTWLLWNLWNLYGASLEP